MRCCWETLTRGGKNDANIGPTAWSSVHTARTSEFHQLPEYEDDVRLEQKLDVHLGQNLKEWEGFYNFQRQHGAHRGKTPYEVLRDILELQC